MNFYFNIFLTLFIFYFLFSRNRNYLNNDFSNLKFNIIRGLKWTIILIIPIVFITFFLFLLGINPLQLTIYYDGFEPILDTSAIFFYLLLFIFVVVLEPFIEEFLFRGIIYERVSLTNTKGRTLLVSNLIYAIFRTIFVTLYFIRNIDYYGLLALLLPILIFLSYFALGLLYTILRIKSKSVILPTIVHAFINLMFYIIIILLTIAIKTLFI